MVELCRAPIDYHAMTESVRSPHCGAVALFLGTVRDLTGSAVTVFLDYEAYAPMAERKLAEIEAEVRRRWPVGGVAMVHRLGRLGWLDRLGRDRVGRRSCDLRGRRGLGSGVLLVHDDKLVGVEKIGCDLRTAGTIIAAEKFVRTRLWDRFEKIGKRRKAHGRVCSGGTFVVERSVS